MTQLTLTLDTRDDAQRAYDALNHAAEQIGRRAGNDPASYTIVGKGRQARRQFTPPQALRDLIAAMESITRGRITPEEAMALLHTRDVDLARFGK